MDTLWCVSASLLSLPRAWLALLIIAEISLSSCPSLEITFTRYVKLLTVFSSMSSIVMVGWGVLLFGASWERTSIFPRLLVRQNSFEASENLFSMLCRVTGLVCHECTVIGKQNCLDEINQSLWLGCELKVEYRSIKAVADIHSIIMTLYSVVEDTSEE